MASLLVLAARVRVMAVRQDTVKRNKTRAIAHNDLFAAEPIALRVGCGSIAQNDNFTKTYI